MKEPRYNEEERSKSAGSLSDPNEEEQKKNGCENGPKQAPPAREPGRPIELPERERGVPRPECEPPVVCPERTPTEQPPEKGIVDHRESRELTNGVEATEKGTKRKSRASMSHASLYACVAVSFLLTFVLMIGALCLLSAPTVPDEDTEVPVSADTDEEKRVVWVHEYGTAEGAMSTPELYDTCSKSVVSIRTEKGDATGIGSGFVWREDGYVATAAHVIDACDRVEVILWDGSRFSAETVGCDTLTDLALLKIDTRGLAPVTLGESSSLLAGERVVAIGTPASLDYAGSVCSGEVSCALRTVKIYSEESGALEKKMKLIQMSAPVNPGNSGCPLFDSFGQVVGVVTMKLGQSFAGIGFAIPSDGAAVILEAMRTGESLTDGLLSAVSLRAAALGIEGEAAERDGVYGVRITGFADPNGESARTLMVGDMLLRVGDEAVSRASDVERALRAYAPGDRVAVTVMRNGQRLTFEVPLTTRNG